MTNRLRQGAGHHPWRRKIAPMRSLQLRLVFTKEPENPCLLLPLQLPCIWTGQPPGSQFVKWYIDSVFLTCCFKLKDVTKTKQ